MASRNTTVTATTTLQVASREHRRKNKEHTLPTSLFFAEQLKLATSIPPFTLNTSTSPQALFVQANPFHSWSVKPESASDISYREEPTRIQLQRQRLRELHANAHLSNKFPGFKTSATFFASLRTNLRLSVSPPPSPMSTPPSMRASAASLPPPSPTTAPQDGVTSDPLAGVPELSSYHAESDEDKIAALKLVADSMAQMRQHANNHLAFHPALLPIVVLVLGVFARVSLNYGKDWIMIGLGWMGLLMSFLAACRFATQAYLHAAEDLKWEWFGDSEVLVTKFGDEIIGTIVIDWISGESRQKRKKAWRGEIRAWTVRMRYRHKGVGTALLEDAAQEAKAKGAETLEFAANHANALRSLPAYFNKPFDKQDLQARALLQDVFENTSTRGKRR